MKSGSPSLEELAAQLRLVAGKMERLENHPWLHPKDVMSALGISKATLYRWLKCGKLPKPARIYGPIWRRCDLERLARRRSSPDGRAGHACPACPSVRPA